MTDYELAYEIASRAHAKQVDKAGKPYLHHPLAVADDVESEEAKVVALLHDITPPRPEGKNGRPDPQHGFIPSPDGDELGQRTGKEIPAGHGLFEVRGFGIRQRG